MVATSSSHQGKDPQRYRRREDGGREYLNQVKYVEGSTSNSLPPSSPAAPVAVVQPQIESKQGETGRNVSTQWPPRADPFPGSRSPQFIRQANATTVAAPSARTAGSPDATPPVPAPLDTAQRKKWSWLRKPWNRLKSRQVSSSENNMQIGYRDEEGNEVVPKTRRTKNQKVYGINH